MARGKHKRKVQIKFLFRMKKKLVVMFIIITLALIALIGRIMYVQTVNGDEYEKIVLSQQQYDSQTIPYKRGDIVDRKGTILATSTDVYNVILDCKAINSKDAYVEATIAALTQCFDVTAEELRTELSERASSQYYVLKRRLSYDEIQSFVEIQEDDERSANVKGVWFEKEYIRTYPYNSLASAVIGFTTSGNAGINGLENYYNDTLNGTNGREYGYLNSESDFEKTIVEPEDGQTLVTTIDANIQSIVEEKILAFNQQYENNFREGTGSTNTGVIVMDPNNGEVLAMANYPTYDLNNAWDLSAYYTEDEIAAMDEEQQLDALNEIWNNFCLTYTFEPGSTIKPFTVATGLETGTLTGNETYVCDGGETLGGRLIGCVNRNGHGVETVQTALMDSCNDALMQMSYSIGAENLSKYQNIFNFGLRTNIDLPGEARTDTLIYAAEDMGVTTAATNAFGQNFNTTMIQVATGFSSLINGGKYYQPHVVSKVLDADGNTVETIDPIVLKETISEQTSNTIKSYLYEVVTNGTGKTAKVPGYSMGGKTGTAEKQPRSDDNYVVSFIGYAPQDDPQVVVYVVIDEPNVEDQAHSSYAQQITKDIMTEILPYMNVYQDEEIVAGADDGAIIDERSN